MPLPERDPGESHDVFIERCMADPVMVREFPDAAQRRAVCEHQGRMRTEAHLNLVCEPGSITIEAEAESASTDAGAKPKLPRFSMIAYSGGPMQIAGWRYPVVLDLAGLNIPSQHRPIRMGHDAMLGVGHTDSIRIEDSKLIATGIVSRGTDAAREVVASARNGFPWQASIGASADEYEFIKENQTVVVNGRQFAGPLNVVRRSTLGEISFVDLAADQTTSVSVAASSGERKEYVNVDETKEVDSAVADATPPVEAKQANIQSAADALADAERILAIRKVCAGRHPDIEAKAIEEQWDIRQTALAVVRASRPKSPLIQAEAPKDSTRLLEAAACLKYGVPERAVVSAYGQDVCEKADRYRSRGIQWMAQQIATSHGVDLDMTPGSGKWIKAAFSLSELSGIVGAVANKALAAAFEAAPSVVPVIAASVSHSNFHAHTVYSLAITGELQPVAPSGELQHLALGEESYTRQVSTRGAVLSVTRQDIINDDLGALTRAATALAQKAVVAREKALFSLINSTGDGSAFFTAANGNYFDGASSALSADSLGTAVQKFRDQTDPSGLPLLLEPRILLVPSSLEIAAKRLMSAQTYIAVGTGSSRAVEPGENIWRGAFNLAVSPYLNNSALSGSSTAWYLIADPAVLPCFEIAYLNGVQVPTVEFWDVDAEPNRLGVTYRVYWDFGAALAEHRAGVKSKGAA